MVIVNLNGVNNTLQRDIAVFSKNEYICSFKAITIKQIPAPTYVIVWIIDSVNPNTFPTLTVPNEDPL